MLTYHRTAVMGDGKRNRNPAFESDEPSKLKSVSNELLHRLDEASAPLQELNRQQIAWSSLFVQFQSDLNSARALSKEMMKLAHLRDEVPPGALTTLRSAIARTRIKVCTPRRICTRVDRRGHLSHAEWLWEKEGQADVGEQALMPPTRNVAERKRHMWFG